MKICIFNSVVARTRLFRYHIWIVWIHLEVEKKQVLNNRKRVSTNVGCRAVEFNKHSYLVLMLVLSEESNPEIRR